MSLKSISLRIAFRSECFCVILASIPVIQSLLLLSIFVSVANLAANKTFTAFHSRAILIDCDSFFKCVSSELGLIMRFPSSLLV